MSNFFKRLPLPIKLFMLVLLPLGMIVYLTRSINREKTEKVELFKSYVNGIQQSADISGLINELQLERRLSYAHAIRPDTQLGIEMVQQRYRTDSVLRVLDDYQDYYLKNYRAYTFLIDLDSMRRGADAGASPDQVMHYYTTAIFRLKTLGEADPGHNKLLDPVYAELTTGHILDEMITYLGIISANFYNALYNKQNNIPMLYGLMGPYDVYRSYEAELLIKAPVALLEEYKTILESSELKQVRSYIDTIFRHFSFDTLYNAEAWWTLSGAALNHLKKLQKQVMAQVKTKVEAAYEKELTARNWNLGFLLITVLLIMAIIAYTTRIITRLLGSLNQSARRIAVGDSALPLENLPHDVIGSLAHSITRIDENNKNLTKAAAAIGMGNFDVPVSPRGEKDALGNAIVAMKENLQQFTREIEKTKEQFREIANTAPVMIWMTDRDGACTFVNEGWLRFTGRTREQEDGFGWEEGIHPEDVSTCKNLFAEALAERREYFLEYRLKRKDGHYRWLSETGSPRFSGTGVFEGYIGTCFDIHEIKEYERRRNDFIVMASHELKTPITSIKGYVQLLFDMFREYERTRQLPPEASVRSSLVTIEKQVNKLTRLLTELLDLSRIETGKVELNKERVNLNELIREAIGEVQLISTRHHIHFREHRPVEVIADRDRLAQVLLNLLTNAVKYSPDSEDIEVRIQVTATGNVRVSVKDKGIGIDKKDHARIFERFYRVEGRSEQTYPGFGIGLYLANEIIQQHEGNLEVESEKGAGSEFSFHLPVATTSTG